MSAISISFDPSHNPEMPIMILMKRNGEMLGQLDAKSVVIKDQFTNASEMTFSVKKYVDGEITPLWNKIIDFKLVYCVEWNTVFEIKVDISESIDITKTIYCTELAQSELSQIMLFKNEYNTELDISRDDYENPTVLYKPDTPSESLLNRMLEKAPHYTIIHVDDSIKNIQRTFSFDNISIYDAFNQVSEEINCVFIYNSELDSDGDIIRGISVYDLETVCNDCGFRGDYTDSCPKCGSVDLKNGYGDDTTIFVTADELANNIQLSTDIGSVKNCFKLEAGDDLMTATIRNCNPNGSDYLWYIPDSIKTDMSDELVSRITSYDTLYETYQRIYVYNLDSTKVTEYNTIVNKYLVYNNQLESIQTPIVGYPNLMNVYYNTIDLALYLESGLMPNTQLLDTTAQQQIERLNTNSLSPCAVSELQYISNATADNVVEQMAKALIDNRYKVEIDNSSLVNNTTFYTWTGDFKVTNYYDDEDTATSSSISIVINDDYQAYVLQKIQAILHDRNTTDLTISGLFNMSDTNFKSELKKYSLNRLLSFESACQSCLDVLIEQGISTSTTWSGKSPNLYNNIYVPYYHKLGFIEAEIQIRQHELEVIKGKEVDGILSKKGLQQHIFDFINSTQQALDFKNYIGSELWEEFISFRRESRFSNSNYISDGLDNAQLFKNALEFLQVAQKEIVKSAEKQHSITTTLKNLLIIKKFQPLVSSFKVGNWLRVQIDNEIYKLRLLKYEIDFDNLENTNVEFSDVLKTTNGLSDKKSIIQKTVQMTTSYNTTQRQASKGAVSNATIADWCQNGINSTFTKIINETFSGQDQTWDEHGMLFRRKNIYTEDYDAIQMKIVNSTLSITDDNWENTKTAIGLFKYQDPKNNQIKTAYGINGELIIGKLLIGEGLGLYNSSGSLTFNDQGLTVSNNVNTVIINPNSTSLFTIKKGNENIISMDNNGNGIFNGRIIANSGIVGNWNITRYNLYTQFSTQTIQVVQQPVTDAQGNYLYETVKIYDNSGNPVYVTDTNGDIVYETQYVYDSSGNLVYQTDNEGNIVYVDEYVYNETFNEYGELVREIIYVTTTNEQGQQVSIPLTKQVPVYQTIQVPVQQTEQRLVYEEVEETIDNFYNTYTVMNSTSNSNVDIGIAVGCSSVDANGIPLANTGSIKLFNNGRLNIKQGWIDNGTGEPSLHFQRLRNNGEVTDSKIYSANNDTPCFAFAFRRTTNGNYIYSTVINQDGILPYSANKYSCGTTTNRWNNVYTNNIDVNGVVTFPNLFNMKDDLNRKRTVLYLYHDGVSRNYGSNLIMQSGGNVFIGSGESALSLYQTAYQNSATEHLFLSSDNDIYMYTNCQNISQRLGVTLDYTLSFRPIVNAVGNLGSGSFRWNNIYSAHSVSVSSDARLKENVQEIYKAKELIMAIQPVQYFLKGRDSDRYHYGFISQQFKQAMNEVGIEDCGAWTVDITNEGIRNGHTIQTATEEEKIYGLRYEELIAPIVKVVQDLNNRLDIIERQLIERREE